MAVSKWMPKRDLGLAWLMTALIICLTLPLILGHGRMLQPPSRASMWRLGFDTPRNYDDNGLNCGGYWYQWWIQGGKCGICGDPWGRFPRRHEPPGRFATGTISKNYTEGEVIGVIIDLTVHHRGWFEFRLCPNNNPNIAVKQRCLDDHLLELEGGGYRYKVPNWGRMMYYIPVRLPERLTCDQCVFQWKYHSGNNWGCGERCCVGCGPQEEFMACADIRINRAK